MQKKTFEVKCTECGKTATVPFKPSKGKPVYCSSCFSKRKFKQRENTSMNFNFDQKNAWARRGKIWQGRREKEPINVFQKS